MSRVKLDSPETREFTWISGSHRWRCFSKVEASRGIYTRAVARLFLSATPSFLCREARPVRGRGARPPSAYLRVPARPRSEGVAVSPLLPLCPLLAAGLCLAAGCLRHSPLAVTFLNIVPLERIGDVPASKLFLSFPRLFT